MAIEDDGGFLRRETASDGICRHCTTCDFCGTPTDGEDLCDDCRAEAEAENNMLASRRWDTD